LKSPGKRQTAQSLAPYQRIFAGRILPHEWQKEELDQRKKNLMKNPDSVLTGEEIYRRIRL
jgi:hypothetical protein